MFFEHCESQLCAWSLLYYYRQQQGRHYARWSNGWPINQSILSSPRSRVILRFHRCSNLYLCILCKFSSACVDHECGQNQSFADQISCLLETTCTVCMVCPIFSYSAMYNKLCSMSCNVEVRDTVSTRLALVTVLATLKISGASIIIMGWRVVWWIRSWE